MSAPTERSIRVTVIPWPDQPHPVLCVYIDVSYPSYISLGFAKIGGNLSHCEGHGEEVEGVPGPSQETNSEHEPLVQIELSQDCDRRAEFILLPMSAHRFCGAVNGNACTLGGLSVVNRRGM